MQTCRSGDGRSDIDLQPGRTSSYTDLMHGPSMRNAHTRALRVGKILLCLGATSDEWAIAAEGSGREAFDCMRNVHTRSADCDSPTFGSAILVGSRNYDSAVPLYERAAFWILAQPSSAQSINCGGSRSRVGAHHSHWWHKSAARRRPDESRTAHHLSTCTARLVCSSHSPRTQS